MPGKDNMRKDKHRIFVAIYHRGLYSFGANRALLGRAAYNWGIMVAPKGWVQRQLMSRTNPFFSYTYHATNEIDMNPATGMNNNPNGDWYFRREDGISRCGSNPLGLVMIGKLSRTIASVDVDIYENGFSEIEARLRTVPLPQRDATPQQNSVTWTIEAIRVLQNFGYANPFNLDEFMSWALEYADERFQFPTSTEDMVNYIDRPM